MPKYTFFFLLLFYSSVASTQSDCWPTGFTHDTRPSTQWLSCQKSLSPNANRSESIWISYDFGQVYDLGTTQIWNYNEPGFTAFGARRILIEYSQDGRNWMAWGEFPLTEATGQRDYTGEAGPNLSGISARYVNLIVLQTGEPQVGCAGLGAIRFDLNGTVTSVDQPTKTIAVQVQPNPTTGIIEVSLPNRQIELLSVYDPRGRQLQRLFVRNTQTRLDLSAMPSGVYYLQVQDATGSIHIQKVIRN